MTYDAAARPLFQVLSCVDVPTGPGSPIGPRGRQVGGGRSVAAACGGGGGGGGSGKPATKQGGTLNYGADQEPTGFNNNTSKDNGTSVANVMINVLPQAFHLTPDFKVAMNTDLLDSAEQTSSQPQTIVYKIKQNAVWSDGTPVSP